MNRSSTVNDASPRSFRESADAEIPERLLKSVMLIPFRARDARTSPATRFRSLMISMWMTVTSTLEWSKLIRRDSHFSRIVPYMDNAKGSNAREIGPMTHAVARELRALMARHKYSAARLSKEAGIPRATLHRTLNAQRAIDVEDLFEICDFFKVDPARLMEFAAESAKAELTDGMLPADREGMPDGYPLEATDPVREQEAYEASNVASLDDHRRGYVDDQRAVASRLSDDRGEDTDFD